MTVETRSQENRALDVQIKSFYLPNQSCPEECRFVFGYTVTIRNISKNPLQLLRRHWVITDANENTQEVRGIGVVGEQPRLNPDETFEYTSGSVIETPIGCMQGSYKMGSLDGSEFEVAIPPFSLATPDILH